MADPGTTGNDERFVLGIAYQAGPDPRIKKAMDGARDYFTPAELEKASRTFMRKGGMQNGIMHVGDATGHAEFVESYIYRGPDWTIGEQIVKAGDWLIGAILDEPAWELAKAGKLTGWSPQGTGKRRTRKVT